MKTLNELYNEVIASDELKNELLNLKNPEDVAAFAKKHDCDATLDEIKAFLEEKQKAVGELSEAELEQVAGGKDFTYDEEWEQRHRKERERRNKILSRMFLM